MTTRPRKQLPEVPTGYEWLDLAWSQIVPAADAFVAVLPPAADPRWATECGLLFLSLSLLDRRVAGDELESTPEHSTLRRVRARHLRVLKRQFEGQALAVLSAIIDRERAQYPEVSRAQLLMLTRDTFCRLLGGVPSIVLRSG